MAQPVERPLFQLLEPLFVIERQIHVVQTALESFTEVHDVLEDTQLPATAHSLQLIIYRLQYLQVQLRLARQEIAVRILFTILIAPLQWHHHLGLN